MPKTVYLTILARMDEHVPEAGRGLNDDSSNDIVIMHDMPGMESFFEPMLDTLTAKGVTFA